MIKEMFHNQSAKYSHTLLPLYKHTGQGCDSLRVGSFESVGFYYPASLSDQRGETSFKMRFEGSPTSLQPKFRI